MVNTLLVVIEILSFCIRPLSLAIRLFANMLAGHILLFIIGTACIVLGKTFIVLGFLPFIFVLAFLVLEVGIVSYKHMFSQFFYAFIYQIPLTPISTKQFL